MTYVIGITGASGVIYGLRVVEELSKRSRVDVIITREALKVSEYECLAGEELMDRLRSMASNLYLEEEIDAPPSSTSYLVKAKGVAITPCSLTTLAKIASGIADNLVARTAINALRIRKPLVLLIRETPLGLTELRNMLAAAEAGATILPASPGFYINPSRIEDMVDFVVGKVLDMLGIEHEIYRRWSRDPDLTRAQNLCRQAFGLKAL